MGSYRRSAKVHFNPRHLYVKQKRNMDELLKSRLDKAWREFYSTRLKYRRSETSYEQLKSALEDVKKVQKEIGSRMVIFDEELLQ